MEPVQIDFLIGGNSEQEGDKVVQKMDEITGVTKRAQDSFKKSIGEQRNVVKQIESDITALEKKLSQAAPGRAKQAVQLDLNEAKKVLLEEKNALTELESKVETTAQKHTMLRTEVMQAKDALARLEQQGKRGSAEWNIAAEKLGRLNDQMSDTNQQAKILADDEKHFKAVASGVSGLAGAMSAAVGAASLFGAEQEDLVKIQTRLQAVMAITIGVQQVAETLNKDSYFSTVLLTNAKNWLTSANLRVASSYTVASAAGKIFLGIASVGLVAAISAIVYLTDKLIQKEKEREKVMRNALEKQRELSKTISEGYGKEVAKIEAMRSALNSENVSRIDKLNIIKKLKEQIPGYTAELDREGKLIRENKTAIDQYLISLEKSLMLRAAEKELEELYAKKYNLSKLKPEKKENPKYNGNDITIYKPKTFADNFEPTVDSAISEIDKSINKVKNYINKSGLIELIKPEKPTTPKSATDKPAKAAYDAEKELQEKLVALREQTTKLQVDVMKDGLEKRLAEIDAEKQQEIDKITKAQQDIIDKYNEREKAITADYNKSHKDKKTYTPVTELKDVKALAPETLKKWNDEKANVEKLAEKKRVKATEEANKEIINLANSYADERKQIAERYGQDIEKLEAAGQTGAAARAKAERDKHISDTTAEMIMSTDLYKTATDEKLNISAEATAKLIEDIKKRIVAEQAAGNLSKEKAKEMLDQLNKTGVARRDNSAQNNPYKQLINGLNDYKKAKAAVESARGKVSSDDFTKMEGEANKALKSTASASAAALMGVEQILGKVVDGLDQLGLLTEEERQTANEVIGMVGGAANLATGIASGNPVQIIQGSVDLLVSAFKLFDKKSKDIEKKQKQHKANLDDLARAYQNLQRQVQKALGTDVYAKQRESIENLKKQTADYYRLIALEQQKKKKKQDQNAINEWRSQIDAAKAEMENILADIRTGLVGGAETKGMAGDLANALVESFRQGEDAAQSFGKVFDDVIRNAVLNAFKLRYLEKPIDEWLNKLGGYMEDGQLTDFEKKALEDYKNQIYQTAKTQFDAISGIFTPELGAGKGIQGEVKNISEDTGLKLTGAVNAMRLNVDELVKTNRTGIDVMSRQLAALEEIKQNTSFCKKLERVDETLYDMKVNGIKVK